MTSDILKRAADAVEGVTPGPWFTHDGDELLICAPDGDDDPWHVANAVGLCGGPDGIIINYSLANARFISVSRTLIPDMAAAIAERDAEIERLLGVIDDWINTSAGQYEQIERLTARAEAAEARESALLAANDVNRKLMLERNADLADAGSVMVKAAAQWCENEADSCEDALAYATPLPGEVDWKARAEAAEGAMAWVEEQRSDAMLRRHINAPEDPHVEALCERYGYGAVMDAASRLWARKDSLGAFYIGGCIGLRSDDEARALVADATEAAAKGGA